MAIVTPGSMPPAPLPGTVLMRTQSIHPQSTRPKSPGRHSPSGNQRSWLRRFWISLTLMLLLAGATLLYFERHGADETEADVYVPVRVRTQVGDDQLLICKLNLLLDPDQEKGVRSRLHVMEAVISTSLAGSYQRRLRPKLSTVRQDLLLAINRKLPRRLQIRDVLIDELLLGRG